jgi:hypothetical protein
MARSLASLPWLGALGLALLAAGWLSLSGGGPPASEGAAALPRAAESDGEARASAPREARGEPLAAPVPERRAAEGPAITPRRAPGAALPPAGDCVGEAQALSLPGGSVLTLVGRGLGPDGSPLPEGTRLALYASFAEAGRSVVKSSDCRVGAEGRFEGRIQIGSASGREQAALEFQVARPAPSPHWSARCSLPDASTGGRYDVGTLRLAGLPLLVSGQVVDGQGRRLPGIAVRVCSPLAGDADGRDPAPFRGGADPLRALHLGTGLPRIQAATTDASGAFVLFGEVACSDLVLVASDAERNTARFFRPGESDVELRFTDLFRVAGLVQVREGAAACQVLRVALLPAGAGSSDPLGFDAFGELHLPPEGGLVRGSAFDFGSVPGLSRLGSSSGGWPVPVPKALIDAWASEQPEDERLFARDAGGGVLEMRLGPGGHFRRVLQHQGPAQELRSLSFSLGLHPAGRYRLVWGGLRRVQRGPGIGLEPVERSFEFELGAPQPERRFLAALELD